jgi:hypothetical protein
MQEPVREGEPEYVQVARRVALTGVEADLADATFEWGPLGSLLTWRSWHDDDWGWWLEVRLVPSSRPDVIVEYRRVLLPPWDPDQGAELTGIIFATSLQESLLTKLRDAPVVEGVVIL